MRLVLVHGTRFDARQWAGYAEALPGVDVVAVDLPGSGSRVGEPFTMDAAVGVVADAVGAVGSSNGPPSLPSGSLSLSNGSLSLSKGPSKRVVLAGHSLGGYVAAAYAHAHPDLLAGLVLIGASADPSRHRWLRRGYTGFAAALPRVGAERMASGMNRVLGWLGAASDQLPDSAGYAALPAAWASVLESASVDQVSGLGCPVTIVNGQFDQMRLDARAYAAASGGREVVVRGATHLLPLTHRAAVVHVLADAVAAARATPAHDSSASGGDRYPRRR